MDQDSNKVASEQHSHHAVRRRCLSALAAMSTQPSVVRESTPVLLEVLSSAHTGDPSALSSSEYLTQRLLYPRTWYWLFISCSSDIKKCWIETGGTILDIWVTLVVVVSRQRGFLSGGGGVGVPQPPEDSGAGSGHRGDWAVLPWCHHPTPAVAGAASSSAGWAALPNPSSLHPSIKHHQISLTAPGLCWTLTS